MKLKWYSVSGKHYCLNEVYSLMFRFFFSSVAAGWLIGSVVITVILVVIVGIGVGTGLCYMYWYCHRLHHGKQGAIPYFLE